MVLELLPHADELDPKYQFLLKAPQKDPDGRPAVIRSARKSKEQYVQSEIDGKPSGWRAFYADGKWQAGGALSQCRVRQEVWSWPRGVTPALTRSCILQALPWISGARLRRASYELAGAGAAERRFACSIW